MLIVDQYTDSNTHLTVTAHAPAPQNASSHLHTPVSSSSSRLAILLIFNTIRWFCPFKNFMWMEEAWGICFRHASFTSEVYLHCYFIPVSDGSLCILNLSHYSYIVIYSIVIGCLYFYWFKTIIIIVTISNKYVGHAIALCVHTFMLAYARHKCSKAVGCTYSQVQ